jgi:hypothetical protein
MPAGIEIIIAITKPRAMITKIALIFLRDMFLNALVKAPKCYTFPNVSIKGNQEGMENPLLLSSTLQLWTPRPGLYLS